MTDEAQAIIDEVAERVRSGEAIHVETVLGQRILKAAKKKGPWPLKMDTFEWRVVEDGCLQFRPTRNEAYVFNDAQAKALLCALLEDTGIDFDQIQMVCKRDGLCDGSIEMCHVNKFKHLLGVSAR